MVEPDRERIRAILKQMLAEGDFELPGGLKPEAVLEDHALLIDKLDTQGQAIAEAQAEREKIIEALWGPQVERWPGGPTERDEDSGLIYLVREHQNGGLNIKIPASVWVAVITTIGLLAATLLERLM